MPSTSCLCFGRKQWQPINEDDEEGETSVSDPQLYFMTFPGPLSYDLPFQHKRPKNHSISTIPIYYTLNTGILFENGDSIL